MNYYETTISIVALTQWLMPSSLFGVHCRSGAPAPTLHIVVHATYTIRMLRNLHHAVMIVLLREPTNVIEVLE